MTESETIKAGLQDYWCRDEPARLGLALYRVSQLSHAVTAGGTVINLPPCAEYDPKHPPDNFRDLHNRLLLWAEITGGVIFARPKDETAPWQRFNESILIDARLTAQMVNKDMFEVLQPERGDSSSLFLYDVYVVAASAADRFDCQTGTIKPVAQLKQPTLSKPAKETRNPPHSAVLLDANTEHDVPAKNARTAPALRAKGAP